MNGYDKNIYSDKWTIYATGMFPALKNNLKDEAGALKPNGHVVIRVREGGASHEAYVLDSRSKTFNMIDTESVANDQAEKLQKYVKTIVQATKRSASFRHALSVGPSQNKAFRCKKRLS